MIFLELDHVDFGDGGSSVFLFFFYFFKVRIRVMGVLVLLSGASGLVFWCALVHERSWLIANGFGPGVLSC